MSKSKMDEWQAESDAQTLADYQAIISNKNRMSKAIRVAQKRADDLSRRAGLMQNVAKSQLPKKQFNSNNIRKTSRRGK